MIAHMQNPTDSTTKPLGLISEFDEKLGYKSIFRNQRHFTYQQWNIRNRNYEKYPIWYSNKNNTVLRNKPNHGGKRPILRKLYNTEERN